MAAGKQNFLAKIENNNLILGDLSKSLLVRQNEETLKNACFDKIWKFESAEDGYLLVDTFVDELSKNIVCKEGVLESVEWSVNEVIDNVLQHSGKNFGYVFGSINKQTKYINLCIYDTGQGIYHSLQSSVLHKPKNVSDALQLSVKEGVTRDKKIGQGNGLWGLHQIIKENTGKLIIISNSFVYNLNNNFQKIYKLDTPFENGCIVDFELDYNKEISISKALGGYKPVNFRMESLENEVGDIVIDMRGKESGVGTRKSGEKIRNELINIYTQTGKTITLNFDKINVISSSFADELIGKLVKELGFYTFTNIVKLKNMNITVQSIVQRSVAQRMMESFNP
jgi:hypothetical protein